MFVALEEHDGEWRALMSDGTFRIICMLRDSPVFEKKNSFQKNIEEVRAMR